MSPPPQQYAPDLDDPFADLALTAGVAARRSLMLTKRASSASLSSSIVPSAPPAPTSSSLRSPTPKKSSTNKTHRWSMMSAPVLYSDDIHHDDINDEDEVDLTTSAAAAAAASSLDPVDEFDRRLADLRRQLADWDVNYGPQSPARGREHVGNGDLIGSSDDDGEVGGDNDDWIATPGRRASPPVTQPPHTRRGGRPMSWSHAAGASGPTRAMSWAAGPPASSSSSTSIRETASARTAATDFPNARITVARHRMSAFGGSGGAPVHPSSTGPRSGSSADWRPPMHNQWSAHVLDDLDYLADHASALVGANDAALAEADARRGLDSEAPPDVVAARARARAVADGLVHVDDADAAAMPEQDDVMFDLARATGPPSPTLSVASSLAAELAGATGGVMGGYDLHSLSPIAASGDLHVGDSIGGGGGAGGGDSDFDDFANDDPAAVSAPPPTLVAHRTVLDMDTVVTTYAYPAASSSSSRRASYMGPSGAAYARGDYVRPQQQQRPMSSYTPPPRSGSHRMSSYAEPPRPHRASSSIGSGSSSDELKRARRVTSASMHGYGSASGSYAVATAEAATADWQRPAPEAVPPNPFEHPNDAFADAGEMPTDDDTIDSDDGLDHADHRRSIYATNPASEYDHLSLAAELGGDMEEAVDLHHRRQSSRRTRRFPIGDDDSDDHDEDEEEELDPDLVRAMMEMPPPEAAGIGGGTGANGMSSLEDELADAEMKRFSTLLDRVATQITDLRAADEKLTTSLHAMDATCATCHLSDDNVCHSPDHEHSVGTATTERGTAAAEAL